MKRFMKSLAVSGLLIAAALGGGGQAAAQEAQQVVYRGQEQASFAGAPEYFTGAVRVEMLFPSNETARYGGAYVTFAPGARTAWHTHPAGQRLLVTKGVCWTQAWGGKRVEARPGDAVWCPPGIKHWHGASPDGEMTHLALSGETKDGKNVTWLEQVTDRQYYGRD